MEPKILSMLRGRRVLVVNDTQEILELFSDLLGELSRAVRSLDRDRRDASSL